MPDLVKPTKEQIVQFYQQALDRSVDAYGKLDDKEWAKKASDEYTATPAPRAARRARMKPRAPCFTKQASRRESPARSRASKTAPR